MSFRKSFLGSRRGALKCFGGLTASALFGKPLVTELLAPHRAEAFARHRVSSRLAYVNHPHVQAAPQWTLLENGTLALWMLGRSSLTPLALQPADDISAQLLALFGFSTDPVNPGEGGVFLLLPSATGSYQDCVELARSAGRLNEHGQPEVTFVVVPQNSSTSAKLAGTEQNETQPFTLGLPAASAQSEEFSFLFGSCINPGVEERVQTLEAMARVQADFCFLLGDTTYFRFQDWTTKEGMLARWAENRALAAFGALGASKPILAVWDDHDFGPNDANGSFRYKEIAREAFLSHFPRDVAGVRRAQEGIQFSIKIGTTRLIFLDDRTWRDPTPWIASNGGDYLGASQFAWFQSEVAKRDYSRLIVAGGSQFYAPNPLKESYRRHAKEFGDFTAFLQDTLNVPVTFLSGDVHLTEVTALNKVFPQGGAELTSSGIGNRPASVIRAFKRLNRSTYLYDQGLTFARVTVRRDALWFEHFDANAKLLARIRFA